MCGIAGACSLNNKIADTDLVRRMTASLLHRGPDAQGVWGEGRVALGHTRLSIIDLSEASNQPFFDHSGNYVIVFNGEIYNYQEIRASLPDYPFRTTGDTETVLAAFLKWGTDSFSRLKGMFAFAIADRRSGQLMLVRDRLGIKPLYIYQDTEQLLFASEIRSLLASGSVTRKINTAAIGDYLAYQSFQYPDTLVKDVRQLKPGSWLQIEEGKMTSGTYWELTRKQAGAADLNKTEVLRQLDHLLLQSVSRRMVSDVPVAAFLSGGIDSTAIVALMAAVSNAPETFTISFNDRNFDESPYAELVSRKYNTRHHKLILEPDSFLHDLPLALDQMDSPSGDGVNTYMVSRAIRSQGIKVALSGTGGDELFAGYPIFRQWELINRFRSFWNLPLALRKTLAAAIEGKGITKNRRADLLRLEKPDISSCYPIFRQLNSSKYLSGLLRTETHQSELGKQLKEEQDAIAAFPLLSQLTIAELRGYTGQTLIRDMDQMSMAVSLEVREPFFDHELIEFVLSVPDHLKRADKRPKSLLLQTMGDRIPAEVYDRPKRGFVFPWDQWFRTALKPMCSEGITRLASRSFMREEGVKKTWQDFLEKKHDVRWANILQLLSLEHFIDKYSLEA